MEDKERSQVVNLGGEGGVAPWVLCKESIPGLEHLGGDADAGAEFVELQLADLLVISQRVGGVEGVEKAV